MHDCLEGTIVRVWCVNASLRAKRNNLERDQLQFDMALIPHQVHGSAPFINETSPGVVKLRRAIRVVAAVDRRDARLDRPQCSVPNLSLNNPVWQALLC